MSTVVSSVALTPEQRDAVCRCLWIDLYESPGYHEEFFELTRAAIHLFDDLGWRTNESERDIYEVEINDDVALLVTNLLRPWVEEFAVSHHEECESESAAPDWLAKHDEARHYWLQRREDEIAHNRALIAGVAVLVEAVA